ncbi:MAG TPA: aconitase/3-isopropylmalate dehydratase large subunit family protein [Candidatus Acidoferrales bacterium]|nr:aconitase/3-isopropylmalate dehydratase large subunit family protein [Candidatus Acidoferrales bacterium]
MAGKTISEKILSAKSGRDARAGDVVVCEVDLALGTDASGPMAIDYFEAMGGAGVRDPHRVVFAFDHYAPAPSIATSRFHQRVREFAAAHGIGVWDVGQGIGHQLIVESGRAAPGSLVVGADSHAVTYGALNCFATGIGSSDLAAIMICGQVWLRVPETIQVALTGRLQEGVYAKDAALSLARQLGAGGATYQALEFGGPALATMDLEERLVLSNFAVEMGAKNGIFPADSRTFAYLEGRAGAAFSPVAPDADASYARQITLSLDELIPQVALPHEVDRVVPVTEAAGTPVHMVYLGTCTGGRVTDFHQALAVLRAGGRVAPGVQLVVTPASRSVLDALVRDGSLAEFLAFGAAVVTPGCGSCCGTCGAIPGDQVNVISTANRNFKGRMGNGNAFIYLASPASCAAAAVRGAIADPREFRR